VEIILIGLQFTPLGFKTSLTGFKKITKELRGSKLGTFKIRKNSFRKDHSSMIISAENLP